MEHSVSNDYGLHVSHLPRRERTSHALLAVVALKIIAKQV